MNNALLPAIMVEQSVVFQLILFRLIAFCSIVPYMGSKNVPRKIALFFAIAFSLLLTPRLVDINPIDIATIDIPIELIKNMVVGFLYGSSLLMVFEIISLVGVMIAYASGLGMLQMLDPSSGGNSGVITNLLNVIFGMVFVSSGGLLLFIDFIAGSFGLFPLAGTLFDSSIFFKITEAFSDVLMYGVLIALPFTGCALLLNTALAVVSKSAPAMNLFTIGFPLSVLLGILALSLVMPALIGDIYSNVLRLSESYQNLYK